MPFSHSPVALVCIHSAAHIWPPAQPGGLALAHLPPRFIPFPAVASVPPPSGPRAGRAQRGRSACGAVPCQEPGVRGVLGSPHVREGRQSQSRAGSTGGPSLAPGARPQRGVSPAGLWLGRGGLSAPVSWSVSWGRAVSRLGGLPAPGTHLPAPSPSCHKVSRKPESQRSQRPHVCWWPPGQDPGARGRPACCRLSPASVSQTGCAAVASPRLPGLGDTASLLAGVWRSLCPKAAVP